MKGILQPSFRLIKKESKKEAIKRAHREFRRQIRAEKTLKFR